MKISITIYLFHVEETPIKSNSVLLVRTFSDNDISTVSWFCFHHKNYEDSVYMKYRCKGFSNILLSLNDVHICRHH